MQHVEYVGRKDPDAARVERGPDTRRHRFKRGEDRLSKLRREYNKKGKENKRGFNSRNYRL